MKVELDQSGSRQKPREEADIVRSCREQESQQHQAQTEQDIVRYLGGAVEIAIGSAWDSLLDESHQYTIHMLTTTLRALERDGSITRTVFPTIPPRVEYALNDLGRDLWRPVATLGEWAHRNRSRVEAARVAFDRRAGSPEPVEPPIVG